VPTLADYDNGEIGGMMIGRGNRSVRRKPAPVPLSPQSHPFLIYSDRMSKPFQLSAFNARYQFGSFYIIPMVFALVLEALAGNKFAIFTSYVYHSISEH
jgi:hypothetical protein